MRDAIEKADLMHASDEARGGSCFWMRAPEETDTAQLARRLYTKGVVIEPGAVFFHNKDAPHNFYRLAYSSIASARIPKGIEIVANEIRNLD